MNYSDNALSTKLQLVPLSRSHTELVFLLFSDKKNMKYIDNNLLNNTTEAEQLTQAMVEEQARTAYWSVITLKGSSDFMGIVGCYNINTKHCFAQMRLTLLEKHQGKGYASEAINLFAKTILHQTKIHRLEAQIYEDHLPSCKAFERAGFLLEGIMKGNYLIDGKFYNSALYGKTL